MKVQETALKGVKIIQPVVHGDPRGSFTETFHVERYCEAAGITEVFVQENHSRSTRGVLRGLHFQREYPQGKLVRVAHGEVYDVVADINPESPTFRQWVGVTLTGENATQLYAPPGYAHGFLVLSDIADFLYKCTEYYHPEDEGGIMWNDADLAIDWPETGSRVISAKDQAWPTLSEYLA